ncbi:hypothetical protein [Bacillus sp. es.034]|uniref:hypothetical protein n=1 Tax=Bacillus sp. es.034 TaxID=1761763 RepID=UPI000BF38CF2|nr:hypothetical protein [Bacillus sp. es.034]PFG05222.1 hypothetical protein ATG71_2048 [Bacillus sp. es.034]
MPVILTSIFSAIIIFITVFSMIRVLSIAYKRKEISTLKFSILSVSFIGAGMLISIILPFGYQKIFEMII